MLVRDVLPSLGDDVVMVSLAVDPEDRADRVLAYADANGFGWRFAVADARLVGTIQSAYGPLYVHPPADPLLIVDPKGKPFAPPLGQKDERTLRQLVEVARL